MNRRTTHDVVFYVQDLGQARIVTEPRYERDAFCHSGASYRIRARFKFGIDPGKLSSGYIGHCEDMARGIAKQRIFNGFLSLHRSIEPSATCNFTDLEDGVRRTVRRRYEFDILDGDNVFVDVTYHPKCLARAVVQFDGQVYELDAPDDGGLIYGARLRGGHSVSLTFIGLERVQWCDAAIRRAMRDDVPARPVREFSSEAWTGREVTA